MRGEDKKVTGRGRRGEKGEEGGRRGKKEGRKSEREGREREMEGGVIIPVISTKPPQSRRQLKSSALFASSHPITVSYLYIGQT